MFFAHYVILKLCKYFKDDNVKGTIYLNRVCVSFMVMDCLHNIMKYSSEIKNKRIAEYVNIISAIISVICLILAQIFVFKMYNLDIHNSKIFINKFISWYSNMLTIIFITVDAFGILLLILHISGLLLL